MKRKKRIFTETIEGVPINFFNHKGLVKEKLKDKFGVYALYNEDGRVYYVGITERNLANRIKQHRCDKNKKGKWSYFSVFFTKEKDILPALEDVFISIGSPKGNKNKKMRTNKAGKMIIKEMNRLYKNTNKPVSHSLKYKKKFHKKKFHAKSSIKKNEFSLKNYFDTNRLLKKNYNGKEYKATLLKSGKIKYKEKIYNTPSASEKAVTKHKTGRGWNFWSVKSSEGKWVKLNDLVKRE